MNNHNADCRSLNEQIKKSWDKNVFVRANDLESDTDKSYMNLILPWVTKKVLDKTSSDSNILDIGCGCGYLTQAIYKKGRRKITGIDISPASVGYAQKKYPHIPFVCRDICDVHSETQYNLCLAVMVLNNLPNVKKFFEVVKNLLVEGGTLLLVLPHPCFWPQQHLKDVSFVYSQEIHYNYLFATQGRRDYSSSVFYFHRMLETYLYHIQQAGFEIIEFDEIAEVKTERNPDILCMELTLTHK